MFVKRARARAHTHNLETDKKKTETIFNIPCTLKININLLSVIINKINNK